MTAELRECPNPECGSSRLSIQRLVTKHRIVYRRRCVCGLTGPWAAWTEAADDLWNALPRVPQWTSASPTESIQAIPLNEAIADYMRAFGLAVRRVEVITYPHGRNHVEVYIDPRGIVLIPFKPAERSYPNE